MPKEGYKLSVTPKEITITASEPNLKKIYSYNPVPDDAEASVKKHIIGVQGNVWNEYIQTEARRDYQAFPRAVEIAETAWTLTRIKAGAASENAWRVSSLVWM